MSNMRRLCYCFMDQEFPKPKTRRKPGPKDPSQDRLFQCAALYFQTNWPVHQIASTYRIGRTTVYRWIQAALVGDYSQEILEIARHSRRRFKIDLRTPRS
jgi:DNA-binding transcriptional regulator LsrR (DeoR family)